MDKTANIFIALLRAAVTGTNEEIDLSDADIGSLYSLAKFHDLTHIVYYELKRRGSLPEGEAGQKFKKQYDISIYRHVKRTAAAEQIRKILEDAKIPFVLLKGAVLTDLYPEPWMRTSADIDVLVSKKDHKSACACFEKAGCEKTVTSAHDVSFDLQGGYHVELHYSLIEDDKLPQTVPTLEKIWDHTYRGDHGVEAFISDEMFYYYHIVHMAKHFKLGGCGVRPFLDLWLLDHKCQYDKNKRNELLKEGNIQAFAETAEKLSETWFSAAKPDEDLYDFEDYVINGGVYGTKEQNVAVGRNKTGSRAVYYLYRIFPPYASFKLRYPVLKKMPLLLPVFWVVRWFTLLDPKKRRKAKKEISIERSIDKNEEERVEALIKKLEI